MLGYGKRKVCFQGQEQDERREEVGGSKKQGKGREEGKERMAMAAVIANSTY